VRLEYYVTTLYTTEGSYTSSLLNERACTTSLFRHRLYRYDNL